MLSLNFFDVLVSVLLETNGASFGLVDEGEDEASCYCVLLSTIKILEQHKHLGKIASNSPEYCYPVSDLLFFATTANGDTAGFRVADGRVTGHEVITIIHEDWKVRGNLTSSMRDYFTRLLEVAATMK